MELHGGDAFTALCLHDQVCRAKAALEVHRGVQPSVVWHAGASVWCIALRQIDWVHLLDLPY